MPPFPVGPQSYPSSKGQKGPAPAAGDCVPPTKLSRKRRSPLVLYTVQPGDTLYTITRRFGVSLQRVIMDNGLADPNRLAVGQCLLLLSPALTYTVQPGDSLSSIAAHFGVTPLTLLQNNPRLALSPRPTVGQELVIHFTAGKRRQVAVNGYAYDSINQQVLRRDRKSVV